MNNCVLDIRHVTKEYKLYNSQFDRLRESLSPFKREHHCKFYALHDVNVQICKGEKVGIIGANGAGKSTLLKIITGVLNQTEGEVITNGKIAALLELGAGFNMDYTGIENIRLNGTLMGYSDEEIEDRMQKIIEFADIGDFVNQPVKSYSSGMFVRLAFATQIFSDPDILIVDEALSVGDIRFQQKCYRAMDSLMKNKTVVMVTHDTAAVTRFCHRVIWINHGEVVYDGDTVEGLQKYQEFLINQAIEESDQIQPEVDASRSIKLTENAPNIDEIPLISQNVAKKGNGDALIVRGVLLNQQNEITNLIEPGEAIDIVLVVEYKKCIARPILGIEVFDRLGNAIFSINTEMLDVQLPQGEGTMMYDLRLVIPQLNHGEYTISPGLASGYQNDHIQLCWMDDALCFRVKERPYDIPGFFYLDKGEILVSKISK